MSSSSREQRRNSDDHFQMSAVLIFSKFLPEEPNAMIHRQCTADSTNLKTLGFLHIPHHRGNLSKNQPFFYQYALQGVASRGTQGTTYFFQ